MIVEEYSDKYAHDVVRLVKDFQEESLKEYGMKFDTSVLAKTIDELKAGAFLLIKDDRCIGILAGKDAQTPLSTELIWAEVIWFVAEKYRKYGVFLLKHARKVLKDAGYTSMVMITMHNSKTQKLFNLYSRLGFKPMETHFIGKL